MECDRASQLDTIATMLASGFKIEVEPFAEVDKDFVDILANCANSIRLI